jgi:HSP20 family protein
MMTLTRQDDLVESPQRWDLFDRLFDDYMYFARRPFLRWTDDGAGIRFEEYREGTVLVIRAELGGIDPNKDVKVTLDGGKLCVEIDKREDESTQDRHYVRREIRYGSIVKEISVPAAVSDSDVAATYKDGILEIRIQLPADEPIAKIIPVTTA